MENLGNKMKLHLLALKNSPHDIQKIFKELDNSLYICTNSKQTKHLVQTTVIWMSCCGLLLIPWGCLIVLLQDNENLDFI